MRDINKFCVRDDASMIDAITSIQVNECRCVIVLGEEERVVGVFSEGDVLRAVLKGIDVHTPLKKLVHPNFKYLHKYNEGEALKIIKSGITLLPVLDENFKLERVVTFKDLLIP